jgi:hypothetical protein
VGTTATRTGSSPEKLALFVCLHFAAQELRYPPGPERQPVRLGLRGCGVDAPLCQHAPGPGNRQLGHAVGPDARQTELLALLEAQAGLGTQGVSMTGAADAHGVEDGGLNGDIGRRIGDLTLAAAHDPGDAYRALMVGDDQRVRRELPIHVVEGLQSFARTGQPNDDRPAAHRRPVEGVGGLAHLQHHVVGRVDHVADRPHPRRRQPHLDAVR